MIVNNKVLTDTVLFKWSIYTFFNKEVFERSELLRRGMEKGREGEKKREVL